MPHIQNPVWRVVSSRTGDTLGRTLFADTAIKEAASYSSDGLGRFRAERGLGATVPFGAYIKQEGLP